MRMTKSQKASAARRRLEEAVSDLLLYAERWSITGRTLVDWRNDRRNLLEAARRYGRYIQRLR